MFLMLAASKKLVPIDASLDEESEIEEGLQDLESAEAVGRQGRSSPYWPKIRERLIQFSSSDNVEEAIREWAEEGNPYVSNNGVCELCDKNPIKFQFPIRNRVTSKRLVVGSECITNYLMIGGYETTGALKKRLIAQRNILRKQEKGEASPEQVEAVNAAFELEKILRSRIGSISGGEPDFDMKEYVDTLGEINSMGIAMGVKTAGFSSILKTFVSSRTLIRDCISKRKNFTGNGLAALVSAIMRQREPQGRIEQLKLLQRRMSDVFETGLPSDVVARGWGALQEGRDTLLNKVIAKADEGKAKLMANYQDELDISRPYPHLNFMLTQGLAAQRAAFDEKVEEIKQALESEDFLDKLKSQGNAITKILNLTFYPDLGNSEGSLEAAAYQVGQFLNGVGQGYVVGLAEALEVTMGVPSIRDYTGVRVAILRAADDGIFDADVLGVKTTIEATKQIREGKASERFLEILKEEVDDLAKLTERMVWEVMSENLGVNIQEAYKLYSNSNNFESRFCGDIFTRWKKNPNGFRLSPNQMNNIKQQVSRKRKLGEVNDSMWASLKSQMTRKMS